MPTRASKHLHGDSNSPGVVATVHSKPPKNRHAQALSRLGAAKGGEARAAKLSPRKRKEIARKAASARWQRNAPSS